MHLASLRNLLSAVKPHRYLNWNVSYFCFRFRRRHIAFVVVTGRRFTHIRCIQLSPFTVYAELHKICIETLSYKGVTWAGHKRCRHFGFWITTSGSGHENSFCSTFEEGLRNWTFWLLQLWYA